MGGIYGDFLDYFGELFDVISYFEKEPKVGAGYETKATGVADGIVMTDRDFSILIGKGSGDNDNLYSASDKEFLFVPSDSAIKEGFFIIHPRENVLYAVTGKADWEKEAGFIKYKIQIVQGSKGDETPVKPKAGKF